MRAPPESLGLGDTCATRLRLRAASICRLNQSMQHGFADAGIAEGQSGDLAGNLERVADRRIRLWGSSHIHLYDAHELKLLRKRSKISTWASLGILFFGVRILFQPSLAGSRRGASGINKLTEPAPSWPELRFPRCDLIGVDVELFRQLSQCSIALDGGKRHLRLEGR